MSCQQERTITKSQTAASLLTAVIAFIASQHHTLHMLLLPLLGGSASMMETMATMFWVRRLMIVMTLGTVVWMLYRTWRHRPKNRWVIGVTAASVLISLWFVGNTLLSFGW